MPWGQSTNRREMERRHERQLLWLVVIVLVIGGGLLTGLIFGWKRLVGAVPFLLLGAAGIVVLFALFSLLARRLDN